ncbi:DUF362 domain-containing protein [Candidatus Latescibacterota bacterium]
MKRRDFLKSTAVAGVTGVGAAACSSVKTSSNTGPGFNVHPFLREHPEAVFIAQTSVGDKVDADNIRNAGLKLSKELIVKTSSGGYANSTRITVKPNWTSAGPKNGKPVIEKLGVNTDPNFVEGWVQSMKKVGPQDYFIRESCCPQNWEPMGWAAMCERNGIDLRDLSSMDYWELQDGALNFVKTPKGIITKEIGFMAPMHEPDTFLVNIAKMKAHGMGITAAVKNIQGTCARRFHNICTIYNKIRPRFGKPYDKFFKRGFEKRIEKLHAQHKANGIPRWDKPENGGGIYMETWVQRILDTIDVTPIGLNIVEGIYSQDGNGFGTGHHEKLGEHGVTSRDYMSNLVVFGMDALRVDNVIHWLSGHEPGNFGLFHIAMERGMTDVLDPHDIPVYSWENGAASLAKLDDFKRTPLATYYLQRDYDGQDEPRFHLCDEPFDYKAFKAGKTAAECSKPSIRTLGYDADNKMVMELSLPKRDNVYVDVVNSQGEKVWQLIADDLDPGVHQVVWDNFNAPGLYSFYSKGMGWDDKLEVPIYT